MKKTVYLLSIIALVITLLCMGVHWLITPLPDMVVMLLCSIMLVNLVVMTFNTVKMVLAVRETHR